MTLELDLKSVAVMDRLSADRETAKFLGNLFEQTYKDEDRSPTQDLELRIQNSRAAEGLDAEVRSKLLKWQLSWTDKIDNSSASDFVLNSIACSELLPDFAPGRFGLVFQDSKFSIQILRPAISSRCTSIRQVPYDSKNYQVSVPIYYFQGDRDVSTSFSSASYHFAG